ncbi:hypothetical protein [Mycobacterium sp.]|uniref:hypothetical protein n=1 Tax=Mycobacterium sp. TaxID=1785 RepID=UPI0031DD109A
MTKTGQDMRTIAPPAEYSGGRSANAARVATVAVDSGRNMEPWAVAQEPRRLS